MQTIIKVSGVRCKIRSKIGKIGLGGTIKLGVYKLISKVRELAFLKKQDVHPFDLKYGTDTSGIIKPEALDISADKVAHAIRYQTAKVEVFLDILNSFSISYEDFFFIDLGSGKGRALLLASQFPFKGIIGVELSAHLHKIACRNIEIYRDKLQQCHRIQSICEDVTNYTIPHEKIVFYLFNPFDEQVMDKLLSNIGDSLHRYHRDIYIAYLKPVHREVFDYASILQIVKQSERYVIYKNESPAF
jgi:hypothetical protein